MREIWIAVGVMVAVVLSVGVVISFVIFFARCWEHINQPQAQAIIQNCLISADYEKLSPDMQKIISGFTIKDCIWVNFKKEGEK